MDLLASLIRRQSSPSKQLAQASPSAIAAADQENAPDVTSAARKPRRATEPRPPSPPRDFPTSGFGLLDTSVKIEEELFSWYSPRKFYPARIGEVFQGTYQVILKLGHGTASTTWLCRDLKRHRYVTLKIYAAGQKQTDRELAALEHINHVIAKSHPPRHHGILYIRRLLDHFTIKGTGWFPSRNLCLVYKPLGISLADRRKDEYDGRIPLVLAKAVVHFMLLALDFLHSTANLVHGDIQEDNIMFMMDDESELQDVEADERGDDPTPRKVYRDGHIIYASKILLVAPSFPVLCDFGEARFGKESYGEHALPDLYRAPEILLQIEWTTKLDIWTLGLVIWTMIEGTNLFTDNAGGRWRSALPHMARMISLLGPPPRDLLDMTPVTKVYFDKNGQLKNGLQVADTSLEKEAKALEGDEKTDFLRFLRRTLQWEPSSRPSASELLKDPWLTPPEAADFLSL